MCTPLGAKHKEFKSKAEKLSAKKDKLSTGVFHYSGKGNEGTTTLRYILTSVIDGVETNEDTVIVKYITKATSSDIQHSFTEKLSEPYPNPATQSFSINYEFENTMPSSIVLRNITGKTIEVRPIIDFIGIATFNTAHLNAGIYFVNIQKDGGSSTICRKVIIQK